jgi:hypothetical protein
MLTITTKHTTMTIAEPWATRCMAVIIAALGLIAMVWL